MRNLLIALAFAPLLAAGPALAAQPVVLRQTIADEDGRVTLGELFDGAGRAAGVVVTVMKPGASAILDAGEVQRIALANGLSWANEAGLRRVVVRPGGSADLGPRGAVEALTYTRSLAAGEMVGPEDLAWTKVVAAPQDAPRDAAAVIGLAAKRPLRAGSVVAQRDVTAPLVIKKDDVVTVTYADDGVSLALQARALGAAAAGETVSVVNPASKKVLQAVATGPGEAVIGPQALAARAPTGRNAFASLR